MSETIEIQGRVAWRVFKDPTADQWLGICDSLRLTVSGKSKGDIVEAIFDALQALMSDLVMTDEVDAFMEKQGWKLLDHTQEMHKDAEFAIPLDIQFRPRHEFEAAYN